MTQPTYCSSEMGVLAWKLHTHTIPHSLKQGILPRNQVFNLFWNDMISQKHQTHHPDPIAPIRSTLFSQECSTENEMKLISNQVEPGQAITSAECPSISMGNSADMSLTASKKKDWKPLSLNCTILHTSALDPLPLREGHHQIGAPSTLCTAWASKADPQRLSERGAVFAVGPSCPRHSFKGSLHVGRSCNNG